MILHHTKDEVMRYDLVKLLIALILAAILIIMLLTGRSVDNTAVSNNTAAQTVLEAADTDGDAAAESDTLTISGTEALQLPTIELPAAGLMAGAVTLAGTGTPGSVVELFADGNLIGRTPVGEDGTWLFDTELADGDYALSARAVDTAGNETAVSDPLSLSLSPAFVTPTINFPTGDLTPGTVSLSGTGTPGATTGIVVDGEVVGTTIVGDDGTWSLDVDLLDGGDYTLTARTMNTNGRIAAESDAYALSLTVQTPDIAVPAVVLPAGGFSAGSFTLSGMGEPNSEVDVLVDGNVAGTASVDASGSWSFDLDLPAGEYDIAIRALDANGIVVASGEYQINVAAAGLAAPTITQPEDGATLQAGELMLSGTAEPGSEVELLDNGVVIGTAVVGDDGNWQFSLTPEAGNHQYAVRNMAPDTAAYAITATIEAPVMAESAVAVCGNPHPGIDQGTTYVVGECEWLVRIANRLGIEYPALIGVNPVIENPNIIYPGQVINLPAR
jgi:large repetitive protein